MTTGVETRKPLVLMVGVQSPDRMRLARRLLDDGNAVVLCHGPPFCPLLRGERCVLVEKADVLVALPSASNHRDVVAGLALCVSRARCAVKVGSARPPTGSRVVGSALHKEAVLDAVRGLLVAATGLPETVAIEGEEWDMVGGERP